MMGTPTPSIGLTQVWLRALPDVRWSDFGGLAGSDRRAQWGPLCSDACRMFRNAQSRPMHYSGHANLSEAQRSRHASLCCLLPCRNTKGSTASARGVLGNTQATYRQPDDAERIPVADGFFCVSCSHKQAASEKIALLASPSVRCALVIRFMVHRRAHCEEALDPATGERAAMLRGAAGPL